MKFILTISIDGAPPFDYEARGVVSQQQAEGQAKRLYGDNIIICGFRTESGG